jgi:hypothetical protein
MRTDICAREDESTQTALLEALRAVGAAPEDDSLMEVPFPTELSRFRVGFQQLTVFADTWTVDLEGPDELVRQVIELMAGDERDRTAE